MIQLTGLTKSYHGTMVLQAVDLSIASGEIFGIIGKSGAGKSTLLRCINLLERPDQGRVFVDGENLMELSRQALRKARHNVAMIFQQFNLLDAKTVYENIALPMRIQAIDESVIDTKVNELLALVELTDKQHAFPAQLSGGQKQRVAIARALSSSPRVLLCDEATSALDPETTASILALLKKINALYKITIVLITHEMEVIKQICHRVAVMENGQLIETTALAQVFSQKNSVARRLLYAQLSPKLPPCLTRRITDSPNNNPLLRLFFEGETALGPFISQISRELHVDITILLANIDRIESMTCGVLVIELIADHPLLEAFLERCKQADLTVEKLGYVTHLI
jgi:D-methionine transport system ATP-binding protein